MRDFFYGMPWWMVTGLSFTAILLVVLIIGLAGTIIGAGLDALR